MSASNSCASTAPTCCCGENRARRGAAGGLRQAVLVISNFLFSAGKPPSMCYAFASRLTEAGVTVITASDKPGRLPRLADMTWTAWRNRGRYGVACVDVFSDAAFMWAEAVCWVLRRAGKPYVLTLRGGSLGRYAERHPRRVRRLLGSAAVVTAPSGYLAEQLRPYRSDILVLPNALELTAYPFRLRESPRPRLVWLRSFHEIYNPSMAPRVLASLRQRWPEATLCMVGPDKGDGSYQRMLKTAEELGVKDRLRLPGLVSKDEVPNLLSGADIFLNTTNVDNTPVSVMEALACGLCTVSTNVDGIPFLLEDGTDALLVPRDDASGMAAAVERLLTEPGLARRLSEAGRRKIEQMDWSSIIQLWISLLADVESRGRGGEKQP